VEYADHAIQVDDFPQDFGLLEALQQRQQALERTAKRRSPGKKRNLNLSCRSELAREKPESAVQSRMSAAIADAGEQARSYRWCAIG
jgi:hypothetical protein